MGVGAAQPAAGKHIGLTPLGIVAALPGEARVLARRKCVPGAQLNLAQDVELRVSGMGPDAARAAAQKLVDSGARALVSWGCAGGLAPELAAGTLLLPARVITEQGNEYAVDAPWRQRLLDLSLDAPETGMLLSSMQPVTSVGDKLRLYERTRAVALDMESAAVAAVAQTSGLPFLVVRAVADTAHQTLPPAALNALSPAGELQPLSMAASLVRHPTQISALLHLGRCFRAAQASLATLAERAGPRLCVP